MKKYWLLTATMCYCNKIIVNEITLREGEKEDEEKEEEEEETSA